MSTFSALQDADSTEQQRQPRRTAPHPNIIVRKPSSAILELPSESFASQPASPMGAPLVFPRLLEQEAAEKENMGRRRSSSEGGRGARGVERSEGLPRRAPKRSETAESGGESTGPKPIILSDRDSMVGPSPSFMSSSPSSSSHSHGTITRTVSTSFSSVASSIDLRKMVDLVSSRAGRAGSSAGRAPTVEPFSFDQQRTSLPSRPRVNTQLPAQRPTPAAPAPAPTSSPARPQHQRRASSTSYNDVSSWGSPPSRFLTLDSSCRSSSSRRPPTADTVPSSPPPFADYAFASSQSRALPRSPPSETSALPSPTSSPPLSKPSRGGGTVGRLRKKASISFRAALGSGREEEKEAARRLAREKETPQRLVLDTTIRATSSSSARIAASVASPRSATSGRFSSSSHPRPSVQSIDFNNSPAITVPLSPLEITAFSPPTTPTESSRAVVSAAEPRSTSRRRANTSGSDGKGFFGSLLRLKKSSTNLRGEKTSTLASNTPPLPPPLPPLPPPSTLQPRMEPRRERSDHSSSSSPTTALQRPVPLPAARDDPQRWTPSHLPNERTSSSSPRYQRQYASTDSLPLGSSPSSISFMQPPSSRGSSPGPSRPPRAERRRGVSSTRSTSSSRSYRAAYSDNGHGSSTYSHDSSRRSEDGGTRPRDVYGAPIVDFSELVRVLPKTSTSSGTSTLDSHSPFPTALSPPPRRPPRLRPSTASSIVTGSPASVRSFGSIRPRTADGSSTTPFRPYQTSDGPSSSTTSLAKSASVFAASPTTSSPPSTLTASASRFYTPHAFS